MCACPGALHSGLAIGEMDGSCSHVNPLEASCQSAEAVSAVGLPCFGASSYAIFSMLGSQLRLAQRVGSAHISAT